MGNGKAPVKLLWCAVLQNQLDEACAILDKMGGCTLLSMLGYRTKTKILADLFGLGDYDCSVLVAMVPANQSIKILEEFSKTFEWDTKPGVGVTTPIGAISRNTLTGFYDMQKQIQSLLLEQEQAKIKQEKEAENVADKEVQQ